MKNIIVLTLFLLVKSVLLSQSVNLSNCRPQVFSLTITNHNVNVLGTNIGNVDYSIGTYNSDNLLFIDWSSLSNTNQDFTESMIKDFIVNEIIRTSSPNGTKQWRVYYQEECYKEKTCTISLDDFGDTAICCVDPYNDIALNELTYFAPIDLTTTRRFIDLKKKVNCGFKCCYDSYMTRKFSSGVIEITRWNGQGYGISVNDCPIDNDYHCVKKIPHVGGEVIPCTDEGCHQWREEGDF